MVFVGFSLQVPWSSLPSSALSISHWPYCIVATRTGHNVSCVIWPVQHTGIPLHTSLHMDIDPLSTMHWLWLFSHLWNHLTVDHPFHIVSVLQTEFIANFMKSKYTTSATFCWFTNLFTLSKKTKMFVWHTFFFLAKPCWFQVIIYRCLRTNCWIIIFLGFSLVLAFRTICHQADGADPECSPKSANDFQTTLAASFLCTQVMPFCVFTHREMKN